MCIFALVSLALRYGGNQEFYNLSQEHSPCVTATRSCVDWDAYRNSLILAFANLGAFACAGLGGYIFIKHYHNKVFNDIRNVSCLVLDEGSAAAVLCFVARSLSLVLSLTCRRPLGAQVYGSLLIDRHYLGFIMAILCSNALTTVSAIQVQVRLPLAPLPPHHQLSVSRARLALRSHFQ